MSGLLGDFHFLRPWWLLGLLALPLLWRVLHRGDAGANAWRGAVDAHLLPYLLVRGTAGRTQRSPHWLLGAAWCFACVALAGPAWERLPQPLYQNRAARVIALELAPSMLAQDVKPSRVERARYKIADILRRSGDAQTALIAYAGDAFVVAPLTDDANTVANLVDALEPTIMPTPGNDTSRAIDMGIKLVQQAGLRSGEIVLVADAVDNNAIAAATRAHSAGIDVSVLGIGTAQGAPVAVASGGFLKDEAGNISMPRLDTSSLAAVAAAGGGRYATYSSDAQDLDSVLDDLRPRAATEASNAAQAQTPRFLDRGPWLLLLLVPLAALGFRRGWLMLLPLLLLAQPQRAQAFSWADLWERPDQQARAALDAGQPKDAQALARDPQLRGTAAFRADDYAAAAHDFDRPDSAEAQYNLGNTLAKQAKYADAIAAYDRALKRDPQIADAAENRKAIEDWLKQQKKQKDDQQASNGQHEGNKNDQQQQSSGGADNSQPSQDGNKDEQSGSSQQNSGEQKDEQQQQGEQQGQSQDGKQQDGQQQESQAGSQQNGQDSSQSGAQASKDDKTGKAPPPADSQAAEKKAQEQMKQAMDKALQGGPEGKDKQPVRLGAQEAGTHNEKQQAVEQWLQRVPDDPGGLLRRKFQAEALRRQQRGELTGDKP